MKIAFDAKRAYHNQRGLGNYSRDYIRLLSLYAPETDIFLFNPKHKNSIQLPFANKIEEIVPTGIWKFFPSVWRSAGCCAELKSLNIDIYHGLSGELPYNIHRTNVQKIVTIHDAIFVRYPHLYSPTYRTLFLEKCKYACRVADKIIAISEQTRQDCIECFGAEERKIEVVYQGCSNIFRQKVSEEQKKTIREKYNLPENYILDVGAIEPRKNLENLLRALAISRLDTTLVVVGGNNKYADKMKQLAKELGVQTLFLHNTDFVDFPALYQQALTLAYPSQFEGFGIPILEGLCSNIPVLTSKGSCFAETGGDAALYANPNDINDIADCLVRITTDNNLRKQMIEKGKVQAEKFTDEKIGNRIKLLYNL